MRLDILPLSYEHTCSLMNFFEITKNIFKQIQPYTVLTQGIVMICTDQWSNSHVFRKCILFWRKLINSLPSSAKSLMNKKAQFKVALKRYLNTYCFYSVEEFSVFKNKSYFL
jgi:hypothetical protein